MLDDDLPGQLLQPHLRSSLRIDHGDCHLLGLVAVGAIAIAAIVDLPSSIVAKPGASWRRFRSSR